MVNMSSETTELKPPPHLSVSSIQTFKQCPLKFRYSKIDGIPDKPNESSMMGNFVHDVLEELYRHEPENRDEQNAKYLAKTLWDGKWASPVTELLRDPEKIRSFRWNSWWCIENLWKLENPNSVSPLGIEHEVNAEIGGVKIKGFIDRFSPTPGSLMLTVTDYKTGKTPRKQYQGDKFFQLFVYSKMLSTLGIGETDVVELLYLKDGVRLKKKVTDADTQQAVEVIQETKSQIDASCSNGDFPAVTSVLCGWCSYKTICPKWV